MLTVVISLWNRIIIKIKVFKNSHITERSTDKNRVTNKYNPLPIMGKWVWQNGTQVYLQKKNFHQENVNQ